jgi:leucyl aminopeptidase
VSVLDTRWSTDVVSLDSTDLAGARSVLVATFDDGIGVGERILMERFGIDPDRFDRAETTGNSGVGGWQTDVPAGPRIIAVPLGSRAEVDVARVRTASARAAHALGARTGLVISLLALEESDARATGAAVEGHLLGAWVYDRHESEVVPEARSFVVVVPETQGADATLFRARIIAGVTNWIRQLVETPPNQLGPAEFCEAIVALALELSPNDMTVSVSDHAELLERGFGGTLGVGSGSARRPRVLELEFGPRSAGVLGIAGKGITFDSGGINLKRSASELAWMKSDMAAAAAVAGAVIASSALGTTRSLHAVLPIAENLPGGSAQRPGDVVAHPGGRTTEITDTDSEGRVVLADAIGWLGICGVTSIIDVGTLTDSGAVGVEFWGCWTTSPALATEIIAAGARAGDPGWMLPLHESYEDLISSRVADSANAPMDVPDTGQLAATYLRPFAGEVPWVHIDNGSGAWLERDTRAWPAGPTGTPARALIEFLSPGA